MVEYKSESLDRVFQALSDPSRRRILKSLAGRERTVTELAKPLAMSLAAASKHIQVLERAGLMRRSKRGRTHFCRLEPRPLGRAHQWIAFYQRFWTDRLDALERELNKPEPKSNRSAT
ncbi:metalloregulator ArsR/SmtB family transcription factor [soil metagenome]